MTESRDFLIKDGAAYSDRFKEHYFSDSNGLLESRHVFIEGNNLIERFNTSSDICARTFTIAETGFGAGLNFLCALDAWTNRDKKSNYKRLHYYSCDIDPLSCEQIKKALSSWPELTEKVNCLSPRYPKVIVDQWVSVDIRDDVRLSFFYGDATKAYRKLIRLPKLNFLEELEITAEQEFPQPLINAWFFDGFSPGRNPDIWSLDLFLTAARLSNNASTYATYTCAQQVRLNLEAAEANWAKVAGFGRKRYMLVGTFCSPLKRTGSDAHVETAKSQRTTITCSYGWHYRKPRALNDLLVSGSSQSKTVGKQERVSKVLVHGAGIAGACVAYAFARRGIDVSVFDSTGMAGGASGNAQAAIYGRFWQRNDLLNQFNLSAMIYAQRFYFDETKPFSKSAHQTGLAQLAHSQKQAADMKDFAANHPEFASFHSARALSQITNSFINKPGLYVKESGYIEPRKLIRQLLNHPRIQLVDADDATSLNATINIYCIGHLTNELCDKLALTPLIKPVAGQVTQVHASRLKRTIRTVVCDDHYITPKDLNDDLCSVGASYRLGGSDKNGLKQRLNLKCDNSETMQNLKTLENRRLIREESLNEDSLATDPWPQTLTNRVSVRAATADYFPLCGPIPNQQRMIQDFSYLTRDASKKLIRPGSYSDTDYMLSGLGSRGMTYAPLCSEMLVSGILGEAPPVDTDTMIRVSPARFIIRRLMRPKRN